MGNGNGNGNGKATKYTAEQVIAAIQGTGGVISSIAKRLDCSWHTVKKYIARFPTIQEAYDDECQLILDFVESKAIELIKNGDGQMIRYWLSTKGRNRGFTPTLNVNWRNELEKEGIDPGDAFEELVQALAAKMQDAKPGGS